MSKRFVLIALAMMAFGATSPAQTVYKSTDGSGRVTYSDAAPSSRSLAKVSIQRQTEAERAESETKLTQLQGQLQLRREAEQKVETARRKNCHDLRAQIELIRSAKHLVVGQQGGNPVELDERGRAALIRQMEAGAAQACRGVDP
jgi:TolA-binding protein